MYKISFRKDEPVVRCAILLHSFLNTYLENYRSFYDGEIGEFQMTLKEILAKQDNFFKAHVENVKKEVVKEIRNEEINQREVLLNKFSNEFNAILKYQTKILDQRIASLHKLTMLNFFAWASIIFFTTIMIVYASFFS